MCALSIRFTYQEITGDAPFPYQGEFGYSN
ncbi:hypothetical protein S101395_04345 [Bacillus sonorensis]|uniref:Uncharacterized protein n=1 Tax=Bacillus sonorensis TaxID=119858 RepID=A0ABN5AR66_9BACI|nr:hypothetical protein S101395_04345 [Bacillus sonorensis]